MTDRVVTPFRAAPPSVWTTGQRTLRTQLRAAGCATATDADPHLVPPAVAARAIATYTRPGERVLDPDCGTGTVLVEALRAARHAVGLATNARWWAIARTNVTTAKSAGAWCDGSVLDGTLSGVRTAGLAGRVGLVLTAFRVPVGHASHGPDHELDAATTRFAATLSASARLLRTGGHAIVVAQPQRHPDGSLADLPTVLVTVASSCGLVPIERCVALTAESRGGRIVGRGSLPQRRTAARNGWALDAHREVLVFRRDHDAEPTAAIDTGRAALPRQPSLNGHGQTGDIVDRSERQAA